MCLIIATSAEASERLARNLAFHAKVSASSEETRAIAAIDGDHNSFWQSAGSVGDHWISIDLGKEYTIDQVVITRSGGIQNLDISVWKNGNWQKVFSGDAKNPLLAFAPVSTQKVKISSLNGKQVQIYEIQIFEHEPMPVFVNQVGYDSYKHKGFTAPRASDGSTFTLVGKEDEKVYFTGTITSNKGDFSAFRPTDVREYVIQVQDGGFKSQSVPFTIAPNIMALVSYPAAMDFMVDVRCWFGDARNYNPTDQSADCPHLGVAWRDSHQFSFEIPSLLNMYFANPAAFSVDRMPPQGSYLGLRHELPPNTPEIVRLIYWAVDIYLRGEVNHTLLKQQLAWFVYAYPWLEEYIPRSVYEEARDYVFGIWGNDQINRWQWHDIDHHGNLFEIYTHYGTGKGQLPPGHNIIPNLMMYEVAKREGRNDAERYFKVAFDQTKWIIDQIDWNDPATTKGQRQGEHVTLTSLVYFLSQYPKSHPKGLMEKIESWARVALSRSDNMWDYRKYSDEKWVIPGIFTEGQFSNVPTGFNEPGNIAGFPAPALAAASVINNEMLKNRMEVLAVSHIDHVFGRNPTGRHFCFDALIDFPGADLGWFQEYLGGAGLLQQARGVLDGSPKETTYPYNPQAGDPGHTEGWVTFNTAWNTALAYAASYDTKIQVFDAQFGKEIRSIRKGQPIGIQLTAPLDFDVNMDENAYIYVYSGREVLKIELQETNASGTVFRGILSTENLNAKSIKCSYGMAWHEKFKIIQIR
ncbi:MAG: discoidin domain-containing protein [Cyclobacteriaceae bacterium]|nr:discoidin domain-containing protein [Cyclobacteriaceae bacterium]